MRSQSRKEGRKRKMFSMYIDSDIMDIIELYSQKLNISKAAIIETVLRDATVEVMRKLGESIKAIQFNA